MSRTLAAAIALLVLLAPALAAQTGTADAFDYTLPGALHPGDKERLLSTENGRYRLEDRHVLDAQAPDPAAHPLTAAQVAALLGGKPGNIPAVGPLQAPDAAAEAAKTARAALGNVTPLPKSGPNFDGGMERRGRIPDGEPGAAAGAPAGVPAEPARLQTLLLTRLTFKGTAPERAAMSQAVETLLQTKMGRQVASEFIAEDAHADVVMGTFPGSRTAMEDGRRVLQATAGKTATDRDTPRVLLNKDVLATDPEYARVTLAGTLGHELFGHALEAQRVRKAGLPHATHYYYRGDELGAEMIDWTIQTELTGKVADGDPTAFLDDPEAYYRSLWTTDEYYATTLSAAEMKKPVAALKARRQAVADEAAKTKAGVKEMTAWRPVIRHFLIVHRVPRARLAKASTQVDEYVAWAGQHSAKLNAILAHLDATIAGWSSSTGAKEVAQVTASADSAYLANAEARLAARGAELRRMLAAAQAGRRPASPPENEIALEAAPDLTTKDAPIDLDELERMVEKDQKENPEHW